MAKKSARRRGSALDPIMAAFTAAAVAFALFALPDDLFTGAVVASGLPSVLAAAQPPLGDTARFAAIAAASTATFLFIWLLLRALGGKPAQPKRRSGPVEFEVPLPRIRRADAHPDAPARRPILAGLELGVPLNEQEQEEQEEPEADFEGFEEPDAAPDTLPWQEPEAEIPEPPLWEEPEQEVADEPLWDEPEAAVADAPLWQEPEAEVAEAPLWDESEDLEPEAAAEEEPALQDPVEEELSLDRPLPSFLVAEEVADQAAGEDGQDPDWLEESFEEPVEDERPLAVPSPPQADDSSIPHLMQRLELGLGRRDRADWMADPDQPVQDNPPRRELDERLRNAIHDLQRLASRGG